MAGVVIAGPGLGQQPGAWDYIAKLLSVDKPLVLDADALNLLSQRRKWPAKVTAHAVLTPHPGEMARLNRLLGRAEAPKDDAGRMELAVHAARSFGQVMVLKGHRTVVTDGRRVYVNSTGDSSLSKAGSGDVLSGIIGSLIGQGMSGFDAAMAGSYLHGRAGEFAGKRLGRRCVLAHDVIDELGRAIAEYEQAVPPVPPPAVFDGFRW